jgi:1-acyl-sn-glycerol-3-phosphate acyltransferase
MLLAANGSKVELFGEENLLKGRPQIFFCNHQSWVDIVVLTGYLPVSFKWMSTKGVFQVPFLGWHMRRAGYISVERASFRKAAKALDTALETIREGHSLIIFPEGTRSPDGNLLPFKRGGFVLALRGHFAVVPLTISGTRRILSKGSLQINKGEVKVFISAPIELEKEKPADLKQLMEQTRASILANLS